MYKVFNSYVKIGFLVGLLFFSSLKAKEFVNNSDKAFYAITSLSFYLREIHSNLNKRQKDQEIQFHPKDIEHLWNLALSHSHSKLFKQIQRAQQYYEEASNQKDDSDSYFEFCRKSQILLEKAWRKLNPYLIKKNRFFKQENYIYHKYPNLDDNPYISKRICNKIRPHLLPLHSPLKETLDRIDNQSRMIQNSTTFTQAGFLMLFYQHKSLIKVACHPLLMGYLIKVYFDDDPQKILGKRTWAWLIDRCEGAKNIRCLIQEKQLIHFVVPDKWLYPPSFSPINTKGTESIQPVILVVTDMDLVPIEDSYEAWKNKITHRHLDELYCILSHGFSSAYLACNIPYTKSGKFACVDTEYAKREIKFSLVKKYLSPEMQIYWEDLVKKGGNI